MRSFEEFHRVLNADQCLEYDGGTRINDTEAAALIQNLAGVKNPGEIRTFERHKRDRVIRELRKRKLSIRQIERLTGISFAIIRKQ